MGSISALQIPVGCGMERENVPVPSGSLTPSIALDPTCEVRRWCHSSVGCAQSPSETTVVGSPGPESDVAVLARLVADALAASVSRLRKDDEMRMSEFTTTFQGELASFRQGEESRIARLEKVITDLKPTPVNIDPTTHFWTVYKKVADEHDSDMVAKYVGDLDTSLLFAGLFSAVATTFIVQIIPSLQPNPIDLTNVLLLRILQQNTSFGEADPLTPVMNVPSSVVRAQSILFASLAVTLFVALIAVLGKQWILYYTRGSTWGSIVDRGKERQVKFVGLQKWGLHFIMGSLPVMLQFALLLFGVGLFVYLWDFDVSAAEVIVAVTCTGLMFYACIAVVATIWKDCPFQTPLSILLPRVLPWMKETTALARAWLRHGSRRRRTALLRRIERMTEHGRLAGLIGRLCKIFIGKAIAPSHPVEDVYAKRYSMKLSNPAFWRHDPLFTSPPPKDTAASAGFWLLENSTDFSAATAVAAVFSEFQWPSHHPSTTALIRLRDTYVECFRAPKFDKSARLKALQSSAAYYVLYHTWLIWSTSKSLDIEVEKLPPELPPDLFLHKHNEEWNGDDLFEYLLHTKDRSVPVTSARFLSYIAPYWFCGDSDSAVKFRSTRLEKLYELIDVLDESQALVPATLTDCVLCVGAAMDFSLHPEDLIRVDKSDYFVPIFKAVVQHIHGIILARSRRYRRATTSLEILLSIAKHTSLPLVDAAWMSQLMKQAAEGDMADEQFTLFLRFSARRKEEDATATAEIPPDQDYVHVQGPKADSQSPRILMTIETTLDHTLFNKIMKNIQTCVEKKDGWHDEAVYGGLIVIRDIHQLESSLFDDGALQTLYDAMDNRRPFRVRKAAYDVMLVTQDQWLNSKELRQKLEELDFLRQLHGVVIEIARSDYQRSFLMMMGVLSEDEYWQAYLRNAMDIWLPFRHEGPAHALHILTNVAGLLLPRQSSSNPPSPDETLEKRVEDEWAAFPSRPVPDLSADRLKPLAEITEQFMELSFNENDRKAVLAMVQRVIPSLKNRCDSGYRGPGEEVRGIINDLVTKLQSPPSASTRRRSTYHW